MSSEENHVSIKIEAEVSLQLCIELYVDGVASCWQVYISASGADID